MNTVSIIDNKTHTRNKIKSRLLKKAAEIWGYQEWEIDAFDPLVNLLIEACSVEFEKLYTEINTTQNRILERLSHVLIPEVIDTGHPACGIMQTRATDSTAILNTETQLVVKKQFLPSSSGKEKNYPDIFFTPLQSCKIFNAGIRFIASDQLLWNFENTLSKNIISSRQYIIPKTHHSIWIGLEINDQVTTLNGLSFFFDWFNEPEKYWYLQYLAFGKWILNKKELKHSRGLKDFGDGATDRPLLEDAFNPLKKIENTIKGFFNTNYITLEDDTPIASLEKINYPAEFEKIFPQENLKKINQPLLWLEIQLPLSLPEAALGNIFCAINTFPVINRKFNRLTYKLQPSVNCIPLSAKEDFLAIKEITNSRNIKLKPVPLASLQELEVETYTLRFQGANRFDQRDATEKIYELLEILRDEYASFASVGQDFLHTILIKLKQNMSRLEQKLIDNAVISGTAPYILAKTQQLNDIAYIDYWTTQGIAANKINSGTKVSVYNNADVKESESLLITSTFGGKEKISPIQKINVFKKTLLTRGRIVTHDDIKTTCFAELGDKLQEVIINKTVQAGRTPNTGFFRCIEVLLIPNSRLHVDVEEWQHVSILLQQTLEQGSTGNIPFMVKVKNI
jgi:hypothetical protein